MTNPNSQHTQPTPAYIGASWAVMAIGVLAYLFGLFNATMQLNEKGYYFAVLLLGLYASISLQKTIRDRAEGIPTTRLYYIISWVALASAVGLIVVGLLNATLTLSEKGFYMMAYTMSLFGAITIQKNIRDLSNSKNQPLLTMNQTQQIPMQTNSDDERSHLLQSPFRRNKAE
ncbi:MULTISPECIES: inner membrane protein YiaA [unclassified Moraxella]|uniref:inner membrane protein YiaA n=1 Tax=unclassified Moraxella TaxID=2685852 RepID=UPI003AF4D300